MTDLQTIYDFVHNQLDVMATFRPNAHPGEELAKVEEALANEYGYQAFNKWRSMLTVIIHGAKADNEIINEHLDAEDCKALFNLDLGKRQSDTASDNIQDYLASRFDREPLDDQAN